MRDPPVFPVFFLLVVLIVLYRYLMTAQALMGTGTAVNRSCKREGLFNLDVLTEHDPSYRQY